MPTTSTEAVSDPTEFESAELQTFDGAFRCPMCKDLFEAPVLLTQCGHTFCSLCIRAYLPSKNECPTCRHTTSESSLVRNSTLEDSAFAYRNARPVILSLEKNHQDRISLRRKPTHSPFPPFEDTLATPRKRKRPELNSKLTPDDFDRQEGPSTPSPKRPKAKYEPRDGFSDELWLIDSDVEAESVANFPDPIVECPICQAKVQLSILDPHIDRGCSDPEPKKNDVKAWGTIFASNKGALKSKDGRRTEIPDQKVERKPLPKVTFALLKEKGIRELLSEHGLSTEGDKKALQDRYNKWIALWNSSIDSSRPKSIVTLRRELKQWERTKEQDSTEKKAREKKTKDSTAYMIQYGAHFADLTARAKATLQRKRPPEGPPQAPDAADSFNREGQEGGNGSLALGEDSSIFRGPSIPTKASPREDVVIILD